MKAENRLSDFTKGQRVSLTDGVLHKEYAGQRGTVEKTVKSRGVVCVRLDSGKRYDAKPENVEPQ